MIPTELLNNSAGSLGPVLATWLIWPVLCGGIAARKGELRRGAIQGLLWGPIGLIIVLLMERKYVCPTCGHKTLKQPHAVEARPIEAPRPLLVPATPNPASAAEHRAPRPMSEEEREVVVAAACAGYDAQEEARLRSWLNNESLRS